jgi:serine/threonine protein phosphatase PrpC
VPSGYSSACSASSQPFSFEIAASNGFAFVCVSFSASGFFVSLMSLAVSRYELKPLDEMLVLCSDGVIENNFFCGVTANVVEAARDFVTAYGFEEAPGWLCDKAVEHSCDDNVTAVFVRFCEIKPKPRRSFKK